MSKRTFAFSAHNLSVWNKGLCMRQRASWTYPPQVFTSVDLFNKNVRSGFTINSPLFKNNWVKIHHRKNKVGWRFTKLICFFKVKIHFQTKKIIKQNKTKKQNKKKNERSFKIHRASNIIRWRFTKSKNKIG